MSDDLPPRCRARQYSDMMRCTDCRLTWDTNDTAPECPLQAPPPVAPVVEFHPLTEHTRNWLFVLSREAVVRQSMNPGVTRALIERGFAAEIELPSPFRSHKGRRLPHLQITAAGRRHLKEIGK